MALNTAKDFGKLIKSIRKKAQLTQKELAAASGIGERFIRELEQGKPSCQLEKTLLVMRMLGIQLSATPPSNYKE